MRQCRKIKFYNTGICIGDLNRKINIYTRKIKAPNFLNTQGVEFTEQFDLVITTWSAIQPTKAINVFAGLNTDLKDKTHDIYIRYRDDINSSQFIQFRDKYYDILKVENLDENKRFLKLECKQTGQDDLLGSQL
jgi:SPP1 family predicted phage head-tail adaptor